MIFNFFKSKQQQLFDAIEANNLSKVKHLISDPKLDINAQIKDGATALHYAACGRLEICQFLVRKGADVNTTDNAGWTPLQVSILRGHNEITVLLIQNGGDIHVTDSSEHTLLHYATEQGNLEIAKLLIEKKADVNAADDDDGCTPLHNAAEKGNLEIAKLLLDHGADVNATDDRGNRPLYYVVDSDSELYDLLK